MVLNGTYFADGETRPQFGIPRGSKAAPCMLPSPRAEQLPAILFISMSRGIAFRHSVSSPSRYVTAVLVSRPERDRCLSTIRSGPPRGSSARPSRKTWGEHSFAEEAKVEANYRVASREGGLMRSSMTGHIRCPPLPPFLLLPLTMSGVKEHRPLRKFYHRYVRLSVSLSLSLRSPVSIRSPRAFSISFLPDSLRGSFLLSIETHRRSSLTVRYSSTVPSVRSEERSER